MEIYTKGEGHGWTGGRILETHLFTHISLLNLLGPREPPLYNKDSNWKPNRSDMSKDSEKIEQHSTTMLCIALLYSTGSLPQRTVPGLSTCRSGTIRPPRAEKMASLRYLTIEIHPSYTTRQLETTS